VAAVACAVSAGGSSAASSFSTAAVVRAINAAMESNRRRLETLLHADPAALATCDAHLRAVTIALARRS
jgi:hypothetical protein